MKIEELDLDKIASDFRRDGFVFIPGFLNDTEIGQVNENLKKFISFGLKNVPSDMVYYENVNEPESLKQIQKLFDYDEGFKGLMFGSKFEKFAEVLLNDSVRGVNMQYFNKPPKISQPTPPHQDGYFFMLEPNEAVTMWMPLEPVDEENGCVRYISGSHEKGMREHSRTSILGFSQAISDYSTEDELQEVYFKTQPGDLLVHHSLTIHRADGNKSKSRTRKAMGFIYYANSAKENKEAHEEYQRKLAEDLADKGKIKG